MLVSFHHGDGGSCQAIEHQMRLISSLYLEAVCHHKAGLYALESHDEILEYLVNCIGRLELVSADRLSQKASH